MLGSGCDGAEKLSRVNCSGLCIAGSAVGELAAGCSGKPKEAEGVDTGSAGSVGSSGTEGCAIASFTNELETTIVMSVRQVPMGADLSVRVINH